MYHQHSRCLAKALGWKPVQILKQYCTLYRVLFVFGSSTWTTMKTCKKCDRIETGEKGVFSSYRGRKHCHVKRLQNLTITHKMKLKCFSWSESQVSSFLFTNNLELILYWLELIPYWLELIPYWLELIPYWLELILYWLELIPYWFSTSIILILHCFWFFPKHHTNNYFLIPINTNQDPCLGWINWGGLVLINFTISLGFLGTVVYSSW